MATQATGAKDQYAVTLTAYRNCDDVFLCWRTFEGGQADRPVPGALGFMIERQRTGPSGDWQAVEVLRNRVGFADAPPGADSSQPTSIWPFQRYDWTDHGANSGQTVRYRISPMALPAGGAAGAGELTPIFQSDWTEPIDVSAVCGNGTSAFFNRGAVMSQYVARIARQNQWTPQEIKEHLADLQEPLRRFLSGELRLALLKLLDEAIENFSLSFYAALYELSDEELIDRLKKLGSRAHVVLSNGSNRTGDGNGGADGQLREVIDLRRRMLLSKGLGHNKFAVLYNENQQKALKAWTGSTNWASTGLCTQLNNGILFEDERIAAVYHTHWKALADAKNDFTPALLQANNASPHDGGPGSAIWFTRVTKPHPPEIWARDVRLLIDLVQSAQTMILFVMFQPGQEPLQTILRRGAAGLYVRGVVSTVTPAAEESFTLAGLDPHSKEYRTQLIQPEGVGQDFGAWVKEVTRREFLFPNQHPGIGHAITHAKMIVIDPGSASCKVVTGSHNFSKSASVENDENFVVVEGNPKLAEAYAVACLGTYDHYRWRAYLKDKFDAGQQPWSHLSDSATWQQRYLASAALRRHLGLWCP